MEEKKKNNMEKDQKHTLQYLFEHQELVIEKFLATYKKYPRDFNVIAKELDISEHTLRNFALYGKCPVRIFTLTKIINWIEELEEKNR